MSLQSNSSIGKRRGLVLTARVMLFVQLLVAVLVFAMPTQVGAIGGGSDQTFVASADLTSAFPDDAEGPWRGAGERVVCQHSPTVPPTNIPVPVSSFMARLVAHWPVPATPAGLTVLPQPRPPKAS